MMENRSFWGYERPRAAQKPSKKVGGFAPYLFKGFLGRPGPPRTLKRRIFRQITKPPFAKPPFLVPRNDTTRGILASFAQSARRLLSRDMTLQLVQRSYFGCVLHPSTSSPQFNKWCCRANRYTRVLEFSILGAARAFPNRRAPVAGYLKAVWREFLGATKWP